MSKFLKYFNNKKILGNVFNSEIKGNDPTIRFHYNVKAVIDTNVNIASFTPGTHDGISIIDEDVVLCIGQTDKKENGIRILNGTVLDRFDNFTHNQFQMITVSAGNKYGNTIWYLQEGNVFGTDDLIFVRMNNEIQTKSISNATYVGLAPTDINDTTLPVKANQKYLIEAMFFAEFIGTINTPELQLKVSVPSGSSAFGHFSGNVVPATVNQVYFMGNSAWYDLTNFTDGYNMGTGSKYSIFLKGQIIVGSTAGNIKLQSIADYNSEILITNAGYIKLTKQY